MDLASRRTVSILGRNTSTGGAVTEPDTASLLLTRIVIERRLGDDGDSVTAEFTDNNGDQPGHVEILGMLELTNDTAVRAAMGETGCDCEDCDDEDEQ